MKLRNEIFKYLHDANAESRLERQKFKVSHAPPSAQTGRRAGEDTFTTDTYIRILGFVRKTTAKLVVKEDSPAFAPAKKLASERFIKIFCFFYKDECGAEIHLARKPFDTSWYRGSKADECVLPDENYTKRNRKRKASELPAPRICTTHSRMKCK